MPFRLRVPTTSFHSSGKDLGGFSPRPDPPLYYLSTEETKYKKAFFLSALPASPLAYMVRAANHTI
jgi:hypothetical protein